MMYGTAQIAPKRFGTSALLRDLGQPETSPGSGTLFQPRATNPARLANLN
jgi:hypothetical protein